MRDFSLDHDWLSINTATLRRQRGAEVPLDRIIDQCAQHGVRAISPWRDQVEAVALELGHQRLLLLHQQYLPVVDDADAVGDLLSLLDVMRRQDDGDAGGAQALDELPHVLA